MPDRVNRLEELRREAHAATRGLLDGQQALLDALSDLRAEKGRAADGYRAVVQSLAAALEARDGYTSDHCDEVQLLAVAVAGRLGVSDGERAEIQAVAVLHDVGKIGIPDGILHQPGPLSDEEWLVMREHPVIGERILRHLPGLAGAARAVRHEHERWDGGGYPDGLAGDAIPLASRVVLACDAWHALVSDRPYRRALPASEARAELERNAGTQFDPQVVAALLECLDGAQPAPAGGEAGEAGEAGDQDMLLLERELRALLSIAAQLAGAQERDEILEIIAEEGLRAVGADSLSISRWEAEHHQLRTLLNAGELGPGEERRPANETYRLDPGDGLRALLVDGRTYLGSLDDEDLHPLERELLVATGKHCCAAVPIMFGGRAWGEFWAARAPGRPVFGAHEVRFLQALAAQVATAIARAELFSRMATLALRDELTGLANRRAFDERLELAVGDALRDGGALTLVLCDLDRLKELNDVHGHQSGDDALRRVADVLCDLAAPYPQALVARLSGDEMGVLLEGVAAPEGQALAEAAVARLAAGGPPLGLSGGVAALRDGVDGPSDLLRAADSALYVAKRTGRGRVCLADVQPRRAWREAASRRGGGRRDVRDRPELDVAGLIAEMARTLDTSLAAEPVAERLGAVATACAATADATAAAISLRAPGGADLHTLLTVDRRSGHMTRGGSDAEDELYPCAEYPATADLLDRGASAVWRADDPATHPSERELLEEWQIAAVLAVGVRSDDGEWLLEIYADARTADLSALEPAVRLLAVHAVHGGAPGARIRSQATSVAARADTLA